MTTRKKRLGITLAPTIKKVLRGLARYGNMSMADKAAELMHIGLEVEEDVFIEKIVTERYKTKGGSLSHDNVWE